MLGQNRLVAVQNKQSALKLLLWLLVFIYVVPLQAKTNQAENRFGSKRPFQEAHQLMMPNVYTGIDSMLVYQNDKLVSEHYYGDFSAETKHRTHSTFKSITALIALIAIDQKLLTPDEPIMSLLNLYESADATDTGKQRIRVIDLLNMTSGLDCNEAPGMDGPNHEWGIDEGPDPLKYSLNIKIISEPGEKWQYCNANSFLLAATISGALKRAGRENIFQFADKFLMQPLNIENYRFTKSEDGQFLNGQGNAYFLPQDLAKLGLLVLKKGQWHGNKIVSPELLEPIYQSNQKINWSFAYVQDQVPQIKTTYAHQWYKTVFYLGKSKTDVLHSWGNGGQFIFVVPEAQAVVVFTGSNQGNFPKQKQVFEIMLKYVLPELLAMIDKE